MLCSLCLSLLLAAAPAAADERFPTWTVTPAPAEAGLPASVSPPLPNSELAEHLAHEPLTPLASAARGLRDQAGRVWLGGEGGLMLLEPGAKRWQLFHSRRWLPEDRVTGLAVDDKGVVWVGTPGGIVRFKQEQTTLERKMQAIHDTLRKHHVREGLVGSVELKTPGTLAGGWFKHTDDNDGLWTSMYAGGEAFRYGATGAADAKRNAWEAVQALMRLEEITGIQGFAARSIVPASEEPQKYGGQWHKSADGRWWWKGDTSSDELDGHYFAYAVYYDLAADEAQRAQIRGVVARMTDHILDHGYYYVGPDGTHTTWGVWAPERLNHDLEWHMERGLNSLELLSHLKVASHITGDPKYAAVARELIEKHAYATNTIDQKLLWPPHAVNHSDDELAFLAYYPLLRYEHDPKPRKVYLASIRRSWEIERPEESPLFNYIYAAAQQGNAWPDTSKRPDKAYVPPADYDADACLAWFRDVPSDTIYWSVTNSHRRDLSTQGKNRVGKAVLVKPIHVSERIVMKWNGDPYEIDGGEGGTRRDDGAFILLPYWMGRYHRFVE